jgi:hypothetical protein
MQLMDEINGLLVVDSGDGNLLQRGAELHYHGLVTHVFSHLRHVYHVFSWPCTQHPLGKTTPR